VLDTKAVLTIDHISKSYGARWLFSDVSFTMTMKDRIGVVGQNGSGKTTLFDIIAGHLVPDSGSVSLGRGNTIGYLRQDIKPTSSRQLLEELLSSSSRVNNLSHKIQVIQEELTEEKDAASTSALLRELGELQSEFESSGGYDAEHEARIVLSGLGFAETDLIRPLSQFSGGWQTRVELAKLLFLKPDLLILDEPTNHLDLETIRWFEDHLRKFRGAILLTSHDRAFLDNVVEKIIAIENDDVIFFSGNYDEYVIARQRDMEITQAMAKRQETHIRRQMRFIERFRSKATKASQVQSRVKALEKVERVVVPRSAKRIAFSFPKPPHSGRAVITLARVSKSYDSMPVYRNIDLLLTRGDKVALVGPNGAGKTTLLKILAGVLPFEEGTRTLGHNVTTAYFAQYYVDLLNPANTIIEEIRQVAPEETEQRLRGLLGAFLFSGEDVDKKVEVLSGGEKTRLALARMMTRPANFLLLDEPTNHLDIPSREILADALQDYNGTICLITHDRTLIRDVANKIFEVKNGQIHIFPGSYDDYVYRSERYARDQHDVDSEERGLAEPSAIDAAAARTAVARPSVSLNPQQRRMVEGTLRNEYYRAITPFKTRIDSLESEIAALSRHLEDVESKIADPVSYEDYRGAIEMTRDHRETRDKIDSLTDEWGRLTAESERLTAEFNSKMAS
jgi:ATP-binding cassette, subfamily F, member 3